MLEVKNVTKSYRTDGYEQKVLNNVSVNFRKCEFASILGPSGSGKTTFLNIIGGLDHYDKGDLIINETSTKKYKDSDWDSYRNHRIGFIFQSYNLIGHQTILRNVMLALTLSGVSKKESTRRAKKALEEVGLGKHIHKRPSQLSGGQMQRVAIARALVNDPEILLADEPTGALDSETSIQIMGLLKKIAENRLVIMVTHNPELAREYSNRIITLKDGKITSDTNPYDGKVDTSESADIAKAKVKKTHMSPFTALGLSFNNLMTKKGRTILVAFAGSIGIIGIALILALSNGFQNYVDSIQEDALTSYPLSITQESADITSLLLSMTGGSGDNDESGKVVEQQYISETLSSLRANDLKSFKKYLEDNYDEVKDDLSNVKYSYSVDPLIYTTDATGKISKINPSNLFSSFYSSSLTASFSSMSSIFSQMVDDRTTIEGSYDVLAGHWPEKYNEMIIVLSEPNSISDLLVYSLGLRDYDELAEVIKKVMSGEPAELNNEPLTLSYEDLMNISLKLIIPTDLYRYNAEYNIYEDMSENDDYIYNIYSNAADLKIVGVVSPKPGQTTTALNPGVAYTSDLVKYIVNKTSDTSIVKSQLENPEIDVFSGKRFDEHKSAYDSLNFSDFVSVDEDKIKEAFGGGIDQAEIRDKTAAYIEEIGKSISVDVTPAREAYQEVFDYIIYDIFSQISTDGYSLDDINNIVASYLSSYEPSTRLSQLEANYVVPKLVFESTYSYILKGVLTAYYGAYIAAAPPEATLAIVDQDIVDAVVPTFADNIEIKSFGDELAKGMTEAKVKKEVLTKVGELTASLTNSFASAFNIDPAKISSAFQLSVTEEEITRIITAMMSDKESTQTSNLLSLGYQDLDSPTRISFYFNSFDGKEHFLKFLDSYNKEMEDSGHEDKAIKYSDTTGILMDSVKTIVNAVSYVLIAFVSVSLVVSSIMIGIITYISVYERTKEIGILRAIGASKHNISTIFNAETFIVGLLSGAFGIGITYICIPIINLIIHHFIGDNIPLSAVLTTENAIILVVLSIILTLIGGLIPAKSASRKDPVESLRSE